MFANRESSSISLEFDLPNEFPPVSGSAVGRLEAVEPSSGNSTMGACWWRRSDGFVLIFEMRAFRGDVEYKQKGFHVIY